MTVKLYNEEEQKRYEKMISVYNCCHVDYLYSDYTEENIILSCNVMKCFETMYKIVITDYELIEDMFNVIDEDNSRHNKL